MQLLTPFRKKPLSNPAAALIRDTIAHHGVTQIEAAEAMKISKAQLSDVIRHKKGVSANLALHYPSSVSASQATCSSVSKPSLISRKPSTPKTKISRWKSGSSPE
jgi:hypothetical protein